MSRFHDTDANVGMNPLKIPAPTAARAETIDRGETIRKRAINKRDRRPMWVVVLATFIAGVFTGFIWTLVLLDITIQWWLTI